MGSPQNQNQSRIEVSKSRIIYEKIMVLMDYISWIIIGIFIWIWWNTRGRGVDCTIDACKKLYNGVCDFGVSSSMEVLRNISI